MLVHRIYNLSGNRKYVYLRNEFLDIYRMTFGRTKEIFSPEFLCNYP